MNALELFEAMKNGGVVVSDWKRRSSLIQKSRYQYTLTMPDQPPIVIQKSLVSALIKAGSIRTIQGFGNRRTYEVIE